MSITFHHSGSSDLGGAIGAEITDASLHNLFDEVSGTESLNGSVEHRCIYVKNSHASDTYQALKVFIETNTASDESTIEIALGDSVVDGEEGTIDDEAAIPSISDNFAAPSDSDSGKLIGNLDPGEHKAIWIRRTIIILAVNASENCDLAVSGGIA